MTWSPSRSIPLATGLLCSVLAGRASAGHESLPSLGQVDLSSVKLFPKMPVAGAMLSPGLRSSGAVLLGAAAVCKKHEIKDREIRG